MVDLRVFYVMIRLASLPAKTTFMLKDGKCGQGKVCPDRLSQLNTSIKFSDSVKLDT